MKGWVTVVTIAFKVLNLIYVGIDGLTHLNCTFIVP